MYSVQKLNFIVHPLQQVMQNKTRIRLMVWDNLILIFMQS